MIRIKIILLFIFPYLFLNISGSVKILNNDALYNCSSVLCSYDKLSNIHENSKAILTELENLLFDVRDEKSVHQSENEYNKRLDLEIKFPDKKDYDNSLYLSSDQDYENEMNYMNPVPYIIINSLDSDDLKRSILNDDINELDNLEERSLANDEEIDLAFSKILQLKEQQNRPQKEKNKFSLKKFLR